MKPTGRTPGWSPRAAAAALWVLAVALPGALPVQAAGPAGSTRAEELTYLTEDYAPFNFVEDGHLKGVSVDLLKAIWKRMGVAEQPIQVLNWARGLQQAETDPRAMLFTMTRTPEREGHFLWAGPIYRSQYFLFARAGRGLSLREVHDAVNYRIGVLRLDRGHKLMTETGVPDGQLEKVAHVRQLVLMLEAGRVDLICIPVDTMRQYTREQHLDPGRFTMEWLVSDNVLAYAFNKATDPRLVARFQAALRAVEKERVRLVLQYGCTP